jgi:hypothetical protein
MANVLREFNYFGPVVPVECLERAERIVAKLLSRKHSLFLDLESKQQTAVLTKAPHYQYEIGYNEPVKLAGGAERCVRMYFEELAEEYKLILKIPGKSRIVYDLGIVSAIATKAMVYQAHSKLEKQATNAVPVSRIKPLFAVDGNERKSVFTLFFYAQALAQGPVKESELDTIGYNLVREKVDSIDVTAITKAEMSAEERADKRIADMKTEYEARFAKLAEENKQKRAHNVVTKKTPPPTVDMPLPTVESNNNHVTE